jgi:hypothetical protein
MSTQRSEAEAQRPPSPEEQTAREFPVREYIGAMALELAQMARFDGDEALGRLLDAASTMSAEPLVRHPFR